MFCVDVFGDGGSVGGNGCLFVEDGAVMKEDKMKKDWIALFVAGVVVWGLLAFAVTATALAVGSWRWALS